MNTDTKAVLNLGCGTDHHEDAWNVDANPGCRPDEVHDLRDRPWPDAWQGAQTIRMQHVLEHLPDIGATLDEAARILAPGGVLDVVVPIGNDARADHTHRWGEHGQPWTWRTPEMYCGREAWQTDRPLRVVDRDVDLWSVAASERRRAWQEWRWRRRMEKNGAGEWCFGLPTSCGEFRVVFRGDG